MSLESAEVVSSSASVSMGPQAASAGRWTAKLGAYALATVAITFVLLRPTRRRSGSRGSLFLGSGVIVVLIKTLLSVHDGSDAPSGPVLAAATPAKAVSPVSAAKPNVPPAQPRPQPVDARPAEPSASASASSVPARPKPAAPPAASKSAPAPAAAGKGAAPVGNRYADKASGYSVQLPVGWTYKTFTDGGCWVLDATDGQSAVISIGFSPFPAHVTVDDVSPERVTKGLQGRAGTVVHAYGFTMVGGRRCLWHKYTGPIPRAGGSPRMTVVHYLLPLQDGRALELRVAAMPEKFNEMAAKMKQSVDSFKLLTPVASAGGR